MVQFYRNIFNYILFYLCINLSLQQDIKNLIKILVDKSSSSFYINASFDKLNSFILPLKIELNDLTTSIECNISSNNIIEKVKESTTANILNVSQNEIISCSNDICYKLVYDENKCDESLDNICSYISSYNYNYNKINIGIYIKHYFNIFLNDINFIQKNNILPIGCIENNINENNTAGVLSLGGDNYGFLYHFYKENNYKVNDSFFAICLDPEEGGYLTFGESTNKYHLNDDLPLNFKYNIKGSYYILKIQNMFFNHDNFNKEEYNAIFNMNNKYTYVNKNIINNLFLLFKEFLTKEILDKYQLNLDLNINDLNTYGICFVNKNLEDKQFKEKLFIIFPPLFFGIQNKYYKLNSEYYLYEKNKNKDIYCIGLLPNGKNEELIELGLNFMYSHELIFNFSKKEIIVYESNCSMKPTKKKIEVKLESKYTKINGYLKILIFILIIIVLFLIFVIFRLKKRRSFLCIKLIGKEVTNEDINLFFKTNYEIIK